MQVLLVFGTWCQEYHTLFLEIPTCFFGCESKVHLKATRGIQQFSHIWTASGKSAKYHLIGRLFFMFEMVTLLNLQLIFGVVNLVTLAVSQKFLQSHHLRCWYLSSLLSSLHKTLILRGGGLSPSCHGLKFLELKELVGVGHLGFWMLWVLWISSCFW